MTNTNQAFKNHNINYKSFLKHSEKDPHRFDKVNVKEVFQGIWKKYGGVDVKEQEQDRLRKEAEQKKEDRADAIKNFVRHCNFPKKYDEAVLTAFTLPNGSTSKNQERVIVDLKTAWNDASKKFIVLFGGFGLGKTHFAIAIGKLMLHQCHQVKFIRAYDYAEGENDFKRDVSNFKDSKILILDELGDENILQRHFGAIRELLMHRDANNLRTIITSNLDLDLSLSDGGELGRFVGERIYDRLGNSVGAVSFGNGKSLRPFVGNK